MFVRLFLAYIPNGIYSVQPELSEPETFAPNVVSLDVEKYESLVRKFQLPFQSLEASTAVGPFFWWCLDTESANPKLRKHVFTQSSYYALHRITLSFASAYSISKYHQFVDY